MRQPAFVPAALRLLLLTGTALLTACAGSQPPVYYTLVPPASATPAPEVQAARLLVYAGPVDVPDVFNQPDVQVLSGTNQVVRLPRALWRGDLAEELRTAVLASVLRDGRIAPTPAPGYALGATIPSYALHLAVNRLDLAPGQYARLDASWSVQAQLQRDSKGRLTEPAVCRASWQTPLAGHTLSDAVQAQQQMVQQWGARIRRQLLGLSGQLPDVGVCGD